MQWKMLGVLVSLCLCLGVRGSCEHFFQFDYALCDNTTFGDASNFFQNFSFTDSLFDTLLACLTWSSILQNALQSGTSQLSQIDLPPLYRNLTYLFVFMSVLSHTASAKDVHSPPSLQTRSWIWRTWKHCKHLAARMNRLILPCREIISGQLSIIGPNDFNGLSRLASLSVNLFLIWRIFRSLKENMITWIAPNAFAMLNLTIL